MLDKVEFLTAFSIISKLNVATFGNGKALTASEQETLDKWIAKSATHQEKFERYTRREWLEWGNILLPDTRRLLSIEELLVGTFETTYGAELKAHYRYFFLTALFVVVGLSKEELRELKLWAASEERHQRVFDLFTSDQYAAIAIGMVQNFTNPTLYDWYLKKYHTQQPSRLHRIWRIFTKPR